MTLRGRIGARGEVLLFFAALDLIYAFSLLKPPRPLTALYAWPQQLLPLPVWAALWAGVGVTLLAYAFVRGDDTPAFVVAVMLKIAWGVVALLGWLSGEFDRGYLTAAIWLGAARLVYRMAGGVPPARRRDPED